MAKPVPECWSSCTRTPGTISPSMTNSAWAMARSATETQRQSLTGSPLWPRRWTARHSQGRRGRLEAGADLNGGVHAYGHGDGQGPPQLLRALGHGPDVAAAGLQEDGQLVPPWMHSLCMVTSEQPVSGCVA